MPTGKKTQNPDILPGGSQNTDLTQLKQLIEQKAEAGDVEGLNNLLKEVQQNTSLNQEDIESLETLVNEKIQGIKEQIQEAANALASTITSPKQIVAMTENANSKPKDNGDWNSAPSDPSTKGLGFFDWCKEHRKGLGLGAAGIGALLWWRRRKKKKEEKKSEQNTDHSTEKRDEDNKPRYEKRRGKLGIGAGIAGITLPFMPDSFKTTLTDIALTCKDKVRDAWYRITGKENEKPLNVKESFTDATTHFMATKHYDNIPVNLKFNYNEQTQTVKAFGYDVKVDIKNHIETSRIDGLDLKFKTYQELFETAFLIGFLKYLFRGKCLPNENNAYFSLNSKSGDIEVNLDKEGVEEAVSGSGNQVTSLCLRGGFTLTTLVAALTKNMGATVGTAALTLVASVLGGAYMEGNNFLHDHCASIDNENGKKRLINYLNNMKGWAKGNQDFSDVHDSEIKKEVIEIGKEIEGTKTSESRGSERGIDAIPDPNNPNHLTLQSYGNEVSITIDDSDSQNKKLSIDGLSVTFPLKEGIRFANWLNFLKKNYPQGSLKSDDDSHDNLLYNYFYYDNKFGKKGIFANVDGVFDIDDRVLEDSPDNNQPGQFQTFFQNKDACLSYINHLTIAGGRSIRAKDTVNLQFPEHSGGSGGYQQAT